MSENEELQEALLDLERARSRECGLRAEAEALVAGLALLARPGGSGPRIHDLLDVLRGVFTFDSAAVLLLDEEGLLRTAAATTDALGAIAIRAQTLFGRVLDGQPVSAFDVTRVPEWMAMPAPARVGIKSALHIPIRAGSRAGMLVCTHHERGYFKASQTELARRFAPLAGEMLARAELERTVRQRDRFFTLTLDMMCILDEELRFRQLSRGWDVLGYPQSELLGARLLDVVYPDDRDRAQERFVEAGRRSGVSFESRLVGKDGVPHWVLWNVFVSPEDRLVYAAARNISELKEAQLVLEERTRQLDALAERLQEAAFNDALTGLRNRHYFKHRIDEDVAVVRRAFARGVRQSGAPMKNGSLGLLMFDMDRFKQVNDVHGHHAGDAVLVEMANRLRASVREVDSAIRWGGEEFLVLLRDAEPSSIGMVAERIRATIGNTPFHLPNGHSVTVTCSVGYAHYPLGPIGRLSLDDVLTIVDAAAYMAKAAGRNCVVGIGEGQGGVSAETSVLIREDVAKALQSGHLQRLDTIVRQGPAGQ